MKRIHLAICLSLLVLATSSRASLVSEPHNIDDYLRLGKTIIIVECLPNDEDPVYKNVFRRKVRILEVLQGELKKEQTIHVAVGQPLVPTRIYMIYSGETLDKKGALNAFSYEPGAVEITLWGEVSKAEKEQRVAKLLKGLEALPLKEELLHILKQRSNSLKWEQQQLEMEKKRLDGLLSNDSDTKQTTYVGKHLRQFPGPQTYKDADSGVSIYIESDGRHVAAISQDGKVLWHRDPFADAHLRAYRTKQPRIVWVGQPQKWMIETMSGKGSGKFIGISYDSSQSGVVDIKTGDFTFMGQD